MIKNNKGFIIILVLASLAVFILIASGIVSIGCGEFLATRLRNDMLVSAYYVAISGAELMYSNLKTQDTVSWDPTMSGSLTVGSKTIGTYSVTATRMAAEEFCIVSVGVVNNHSATATVKYGYLASFEGPVPLGSAGPMTLTGASDPAKLIIDGPAMSNVTVTTNGDVTVANGTIDMASLPDVFFWLPAYGIDTDSSNDVSLLEAQEQGATGQFAVADIDTNGVVSEQEAFVYYYTVYLNDPANNPTGAVLNIGQGQSRFYSGDQSFSQSSIPTDVPIIFVNGNVAIDYNDQDWNGSVTLNHTIVATGNISITKPMNRPGDTLTLLSFGNVYNNGTMGDKGGTIGDIVIYANGDYISTGGGKANASIYAEGSLSIDTIGDDQGKDHRVVNLLTVEWDGPSDWPLGLPPGYPADISFGFTVKNQSTYPPVWQRD